MKYNKTDFDEVSDMCLQNFLRNIIGSNLESYLVAKDPEILEEALQMSECYEKKRQRALRLEELYPTQPTTSTTHESKQATIGANSRQQGRFFRPSKQNFNQNRDFPSQTNFPHPPPNFNQNIAPFQTNYPHPPPNFNKNIAQPSRPQNHSQFPNQDRNFVVYHQPNQNNGETSQEVTLFTHKMQIPILYATRSNAKS